MNQPSNQKPVFVPLTCLSLLLIMLQVGCYDSVQQNEVADKPETLTVDGSSAVDKQSDIQVDKNPYVEATAPEAASGSTTRQTDKLPTLDDINDDEQFDENARQPTEEEQAPEVHTIDLPKSWKRMGEKHEIWIDFEKKQVIAGGNICMQAGPLEVFACPRHTKEHEAVISVNALSSGIHAALLAIGSEPGEPVKWDAKYVKATGPTVEIDIIWMGDGDKVVTVPAQELVRNTRTGKTMSESWVFGGSQEFKDEETGKTYYYGDSGEMVCLSNFSTAMLDVPLKSSDANEGLLFEANPDAVPPIGTKVYMVFKPGPNIESANQSDDESKE